MRSHPPGWDSSEPGAVRISGDDDGSVVEIRVRGRWNWALFLAARTAIHKCLAEHPPAVIVDLRAVEDADGSSAPLLAAAYRMGAAMQPPVRLAVCVAPADPLTARLHKLGARRFLPIFASLARARAALGNGVAVPDQLQLRLARTPDAPCLARAWVADACQAWALPHLVHPARSVLSELVTNAVEHAGTDLLVTVARRDDGLYLVVRDGSATLPRLVTAAPFATDAPLPDWGYGLRVVNEMATAWGTLPTHDSAGKIVWASIRSGCNTATPEAVSLRRHRVPSGELSERELEILRYLPVDVTAAEIARRLYLSVNTVKAHLRSIYRKLGVSGRREAVAEARRRGLL
jgi:DNA-binding CsgD family transcriptional regulator/anti-sigma regulatory factor (Ser/Thr protein kinase)/anti-anti-sigma regulatory factor